MWADSDAASVNGLLTVRGLIGTHHRQFLVVVIECSEPYGRANLVDSLGVNDGCGWCGYPGATANLTAVGLGLAEVDGDSIRQVGQFGGVGLPDFDSRLHEFDCLLLEPRRRTAVDTHKVMSGPPVLGDDFLEARRPGAVLYRGELIPGGRPSPVLST